MRAKRLPTAAPWLTAALLLLALAPVLVAQSADGGMKGFEPNTDYILELGGRDLPGAEIYFSERAVAYLVIAPELDSPLLINPRNRSVEALDLLKVYKLDNGTVDLLKGAVLERVSGFQVAGQEVSFRVADQAAKLKQRPPLVGQQSAQGLKDYSPEYGKKAAAYTPADVHLKALRGVAKDVRVRVYFGSWCPVCKRLVPHVLSLEDALSGSRIRFEYYGLPQPMSDDPETDRAGITGVPTAVISVDGKEVGRLSGNDLTAPEASLRRLLGS